MLQTHFQVILSDLSLDAPVRPWMPLCQNAICLTSPDAGACHPKRVVHLGMYRSFGHKLIVRYIFYNFRRVTTYIFIIINIVHMILTFKIVNTRFLMLPQWHHHHMLFLLLSGVTAFILAKYQPGASSLLPSSSHCT